MVARHQSRTKVFSDEALAFDDVLLVPSYSDILPANVNLSSFLTQSIELKTPILSAAMDTVTESKMAITLASEGGIGIIHKNLSIDNQAKQVRFVKKYESGVINDPITANSDSTVSEINKITERFGISGVPIVDKNQLIGIVTNRDLRFVENPNTKVSSIMTPKDRLITVTENYSKKKVIDLLRKNRIEKVLIINRKNQLKGMITFKDIQKSSTYPNASKDSSGSLLVGAAVSTSKESIDRIDALVKENVDVITIDTAHGHSKSVIDTLKYIKKKYPAQQVIVGNIATADAAECLIKNGADAIKVGIGPGSICTTRLVAGIGVPQLSAILSVRNGLKNKNVKIISDGGIKYSGDLAKALAAGADAVMIGSLFAGTDETPGKLIKKNGKLFKSFRGMGSVGAMNKGSADRYFQTKQKDISKYVPEGVEGFVKYKGDVKSIIYKLIGGLKSSMGYLGAKKIPNLKNKPNFVKITKAGFYESMVHNVDQVKNESKY